MQITDLNLVDQVQQVMKINQRQFCDWKYTIPSPKTYPYQWLWDSCFHAIIYTRLGQLNLAKAELRSLVSAQWSNGMIPHMIYWQPSTISIFPDINWGSRKTSSITQPPVLASAVYTIYEADGDVNFVREMLPKIEKFHNYLLRFRDPRGNHLIGVINPDESGEDNSPRFDEALGLPPQHDFQDNFRQRLKLVSDYRQNRFVIKDAMDKEHWVRDVPINCILIENLRFQAHMYKICGQISKQRQTISIRKAMIQAMRSNLLRNKIFWSSVGLGYRPINVKTWAIFMPLYARIATRSEAEAAISYLIDKGEFNTTFGVPTVALSEPSFSPDGDWRGDDWAGTNWRGPVWIGPNWFIVKGLQNYGYTRLANHIIENSLALISLSGFREYYNPLNGEGHGADNFTWPGLVLDMLA